MKDKRLAGLSPEENRQLDKNLEEIERAIKEAKNTPPIENSLTRRWDLDDMRGVRFYPPGMEKIPNESYKEWLARVRKFRPSFHGDRI